MTDTVGPVRPGLAGRLGWRAERRPDRASRTCSAPPPTGWRRSSASRTTGTSRSRRPRCRPAATPPPRRCPTPQPPDAPAAGAPPISHFPSDRFADRIGAADSESPTDIGAADIESPTDSARVTSNRWAIRSQVKRPAGGSPPGLRVTPPRHAGATRRNFAVVLPRSSSVRRNERCPLINVVCCGIATDPRCWGANSIFRTPPPRSMRNSVPSPRNSARSATSCCRSESACGHVGRAARCGTSGVPESAARHPFRRRRRRPCRSMDATSGTPRSASSCAPAHPCRCPRSTGRCTSAGIGSRDNAR